MTLEQAQRKLAELPTLYESGKRFAERHIADGFTAKIAEMTNLDKLYGAEWERGFFDYYNAWKIINS